MRSKSKEGPLLGLPGNDGTAMASSPGIAGPIPTETPPLNVDKPTWLARSKILELLIVENVSGDVTSLIRLSDN
jgi:hypothetical protein